MPFALLNFGPSTVDVFIILGILNQVAFQYFRVHKLFLQIHLVIAPQSCKSECCMPGWTLHSSNSVHLCIPTQYSSPPPHIFSFLLSCLLQLFSMFLCNNGCVKVYFNDLCFILQFILPYYICSANDPWHTKSGHPFHQLQSAWLSLSISNICFLSSLCISSQDNIYFILVCHPPKLKFCHLQQGIPASSQIHCIITTPAPDGLWSLHTNVFWWWFVNLLFIAHS